MSLEDALVANTAAIKELTAALSAKNLAPSTAAVAPVPTAPVESAASSPAPTSAFAPSAPSAPPSASPAAPPTAPPAPGVEVDTKGMPYDGRIHSATKNKVADGSWRYKRGVSDDLIKQVEAELRAALAAPAAPAQATGVGTPWPFPDGAAPAASLAPAAGSTPAIQPAAAAVPPPPVAQPVAAVPHPPAAGANAVTPAAGAALTYEQFMAKLPQLMVSGALNPTAIQQTCEAFGLPSVTALSARPDLVASIAATLGVQ